MRGGTTSMQLSSVDCFQFLPPGWLLIFAPTSSGCPCTLHQSTRTMPSVRGGGTARMANGFIFVDLPCRLIVFSIVCQRTETSMVAQEHLPFDMHHYHETPTFWVQGEHLNVDAKHIFWIQGGVVAWGASATLIIFWMWWWHNTTTPCIDAQMSMIFGERKKTATLAIHQQKCPIEVDNGQQVCGMVRQNLNVNVNANINIGTLLPHGLIVFFLHNTKWFLGSGNSFPEAHLLQ